MKMARTEWETKVLIKTTHTTIWLTSTTVVDFRKEDLGNRHLFVVEILLLFFFLAFFFLFFRGLLASVSSVVIDGLHEEAPSGETAGRPVIDVSIDRNKEEGGPYSFTSFSSLFSGQIS